MEETTYLKQGSGNYGPGVRQLWPMPVFAHKILLEHSRAHSFTYVLSMAAFMQPVAVK